MDLPNLNRLLACDPLQFFGEQPSVICFFCVFVFCQIFNTRLLSLLALATSLVAPSHLYPLIMRLELLSPPGLMYIVQLIVVLTNMANTNIKSQMDYTCISLV